MRALEQPGLDALRDRSRARLNMPPIVIGQAVSLFGDYIAYVTLPLLVLSITGRPEDLGLVAAAETLPLLLFGLVAGVVLDRYAIRRILILSDLLRSAVFFGVAALVATRDVEVWVVFVAAFLVGSLSLVFDSGLQALLPALTGDSYLVDINSRLSLARTLAWSIGPAIGGVLVASAGGFTLAFIVDGATFIVSALFLLRVRELRPVERARHTNIGQQLRRGIRFLFREPHLRWATLGAAIANLVFAPLEALLVLFIAERVTIAVTLPSSLEWLFRDQAQVGLFIALQAALGSIGVMLAPRVAARWSLGRMYIAGLALLGLGFGAVAILSSFWAVFPAAVAVAGVAWVNIAFVTMRQRLTPGFLLGRVTTAARTIALLPIPVAAAFGGYLAAEYGLVAVYLTGSILALVVTALLMLTPLWRRPVRDVEEPAWSSSRLQSLQPIDAPPRSADQPPQ
jgi:MFS family permease